LYTLYTLHAKYALYMTNDETTIRVKKENKERMDEIGRKNESYDDVLEKLLDFYESKNKRKDK